MRQSPATQGVAGLCLDARGARSAVSMSRLPTTEPMATSRINQAYQGICLLLEWL